MSGFQLTINSIPPEIRARSFTIIRDADGIKTIPRLITLSHICTLWRREVLQNKTLWTSMIWPRLGNYSYDLLVHIFDKTPLAFSTGLHIDLGTLSDARRLSYVLENVGERIAGLSYGPGYDKKDNELARGILEEHISRTRLTLQSLKLWKFELPSPLYIPGHFPLLEVISVHHGDLDWDRVHFITSLRHLTIHCPSSGIEWQDFLNILYHLPLLTSFESVGCLDWYSEAQPDLPDHLTIPIPFEPPSLQKLSFLEYKSDMLYQLLQHLHFPSEKLTFVKIDLESNEESEWVDEEDLSRLWTDYEGVFTRILGTSGGVEQHDNGWRCFLHGQTHVYLRIQDPHRS
ncbi:hypothetical protein BDN72DRAFT_865547 [Pluteus cervinus]|uniref:Uncharacterized protein n=1 Tax=Pluteus cervinus TaxID=181527 RepID=A0ACD2ZZY6_9AGAR|nr:hypothetical protein BDN72DRAFT_865547 [Pluteus cervinus]